MSVVTLVALLGPGAASGRGAPDAEAGAPGAEVTYRFEGRGFGHGVGMSQFGARGAALAGLDTPAILAHYYRGAGLSRAPGTRLRVRIAESRIALVVSADSPFRARAEATGRSVLLRAGTPFRASVQGGELRLEAPNGRPRLRGTGALTLRPARRDSLRVDGARFRGDLRLVAVGASRLDAVNRVGLEGYLAGVLPHEVPATWGDDTPAALRAQAIAARSYSLASRRPGTHFDLHADVRSQVYGGADGEDPRTTAAVRATRGAVLRHGGQIITAFYFSTSGGRTENVENVFGGEPRPYLVSVRDPYDHTSPYHRRWPDPPEASASRLGRLLELGSPVTSFTVTRRGASPRVLSASVRTADGLVHEVTGAEVRRALDLRDTWFRVVRSRPPNPPTAPAPTTTAPAPEAAPPPTTTVGTRERG